MSLAGEGLQESGRQLGSDYRIIKELGHGGDGTVYLVRHCPTEQFRAAKQLKTDAPEQRRSELDMMKRLRHPSLPRIYDVLEIQGNIWMIMEYINGKPLSEWDTAKIDPARFFSIALQLAEALIYLHSRKPPVLHLDIKPSNIMIRPDGTVTLIDFGAAVRVEVHNKNKRYFGTPGFAAPEQRRTGVKLDVRTDFYGFGAVLYYCLCGFVPEKESEKNGKNVTWKPGWKKAAFSLVMRCMQTDREKRFPDTASLYRGVRKTERRYFMRKNMRRSGAAFLLLLIVTVFAAVHLHGDNQGETQKAGMLREYDAFLEQADSLGFEQAVSCYEQAVERCPEDILWCEKLLDRIESDYTFTLDEESALKQLIFSVPRGENVTEDEFLEKSNPGYGRLAYRIGLLYWYFYEGAGGKSAAARWFDRALAIQEEKIRDGQNEGNGIQSSTEQWLKSAQIHARISGYYEILGKKDAEGEIRTYWEDLTGLWSLNSLKYESMGMQCEVAYEMMSMLVMKASELDRVGVQREQMHGILDSINSFLAENEETNDMVKRCREQFQAAKEAVDRLSVSERRNELGTEKET